MLHEYDADTQHLRPVFALLIPVICSPSVLAYKRLRSRRIYRRLIWNDTYTYIKTYNYL